MCLLGLVLERSLRTVSVALSSSCWVIVLSASSPQSRNIVVQIMKNLDCSGIQESSRKRAQSSSQSRAWELLCFPGVLGKLGVCS